MEIGGDAPKGHRERDESSWRQQGSECQCEGFGAIVNRRIPLLYPDPNAHFSLPFVNSLAEPPMLSNESISALQSS